LKLNPVQLLHPPDRIGFNKTDIFSTKR